MYEFIVPRKHIQLLTMGKKQTYGASRFVAQEVKDWLREFHVRYDIVGGQIDERKSVLMPIRVWIYDESHALMFRLAFGMTCKKLDTLYG